MPKWRLRWSRSPQARRLQLQKKIGYVAENLNQNNDRHRGNRVQ
jgi:hypothetical protein